MFDTKRNTLIVGLGKTGLSCARFLAARGVPLAVTDSRAHPAGLDALREELPDVAVFVGGFDSAALAAAEQLVVSPGVSLREPAIAAVVERGIPVVGDIELFARYAEAPVVAVTGTNGKSTVTALVGAMAQAAGSNVRVGGNIGTPALDLLEGVAAQAERQMFGGAPAATSAVAHGIARDLYVLELSSFQLETTYSLNAAAAAVLNVSADHMDRYLDLAEYAAAKQRIYHGDGVMVINADDPVVAAMAMLGRHVVRFGLGEPGAGDFGLRNQDGQAWLAHGAEALMPAHELRLVGRHNLANALAALALGSAVGIPNDAMVQALRRFAGLAHRMQWVGERDGVRWYNDSKGTNVGATLAALRGMAGPVVLIAGGDGKGADFAPLRAVAADKARAVVLMGRDAGIIEAALAGAVPVVRAADMDDAVHKAGELARRGDAVLLSPACASFDMYNNYEERGEAFMAAVHRSLP